MEVNRNRFISTSIYGIKQSPISINIEVNRNRLTSTSIYGIKPNPLLVATKKVCTRPPTPQASWVHKIHAAGGVGGFTTMVMVFGR